MIINKYALILDMDGDKQVELSKPDLEHLASFLYYTYTEVKLNKQVGTDEEKRIEDNRREFSKLKNFLFKQGIDTAFLSNYGMAKKRAKTVQEPIEKVYHFLEERKNEFPNTRFIYGVYIKEYEEQYPNQN